MYNEKRRGPRIEPCGIPVKMLEGGIECNCIEDKGRLSVVCGIERTRGRVVGLSRLH